MDEPGGLVGMAMASGDRAIAGSEELERLQARALEDGRRFAQLIGESEESLSRLLATDEFQARAKISNSIHAVIGAQANYHRRLERQIATIGQHRLLIATTIARKRGYDDPCLTLGGIIDHLHSELGLKLKEVAVLRAWYRNDLTSPVDEKALMTEYDAVRSARKTWKQQLAIKE